MPSLSVESRPYGFEIEAPSFLYWVKAGFAFSVGAAFMAAISYIVYGVAWVTVLALIGALAGHH